MEKTTSGSTQTWAQNFGYVGNGNRYVSSNQSLPALTAETPQAAEPLADQYEVDPQSWNLYIYGRNNPLRFVDPSGRCSEAAGGGYTDEGSKLFKGPCANGTIGEQKAGNNSATVGVGRDEANLIMLQMVGDKLSSPHQIATAVSNAGQDAAAVWGLKSLFEGGWLAVNAFRQARSFRMLLALLPRLSGSFAQKLRQATEFVARMEGGSQDKVTVMTRLLDQIKEGGNWNYTVSEAADGAKVFTGDATTRIRVIDTAGNVWAGSASDLGAVPNYSNMKQVW